MGEVLQPLVDYNQGELMYKVDAENRITEATVENLGRLKVGVNNVVRLVGMTDDMSSTAGKNTTLDIDALARSGKELTDAQVQSMSIEQLNAYEKAKWKNEAEKNGIEFTGKIGKDGFAEVKEFDGVGLGTKEYKELVSKGPHVQEMHNKLRDFLRQKNGTTVKILSVDPLTSEEQQNGLTNAIKAVVAKENMQETILFGTKNGKPTILALSDQNVKGHKQYAENFLRTRAHKSDDEIKDWQVNEDIHFDENGKADLTNIKKGTGEVFEYKDGIKGSPKVVENISPEEQKEKDHVFEMKDISPLLKNNTNFNVNYEEGMKQAKDTNKDVIVVAVNSTCPHCENLYNKVINTSDFVQFVKDKIVIFQPARYLPSQLGNFLASTGPGAKAVPLTFAFKHTDFKTPMLVSSGELDRNSYKQEILNVLNH